MSLGWLVVAILGVWRVTHLVAVEDGPGGALARLRATARSRALHDWLDCFDCASLGVAIPFAMAVGSTLVEQVMLWPALSAAAIAVDRLIERGSATAPAIYTEHAQPVADAHDMLRR